jgi:hypothetical protein
MTTALAHQNTLTDPTGEPPIAAAVREHRQRMTRLLSGLATAPVSADANTAALVGHLIERLREEDARLGELASRLYRTA